MNKINHSLSFHFLIKNTSDTGQIVNLFESNKNLLIPHFGNEQSVEILLLNSYGDYKHLLADLGANPCLISGVYFKSENNSIKLTIVHSEDFKKTETPYLASTGMQHLKDFLISGQCGIKLELLPDEQLEVHFRVLRKVNRTNSLYGKNIVDEYILQEKF